MTSGCVVSGYAFGVVLPETVEVVLRAFVLAKGSCFRRCPCYSDGALQPTGDKSHPGHMHLAGEYSEVVMRDVGNHENQVQFPKTLWTS